MKNEGKKYELTDITKTCLGHKLYRIRALRNISNDVKAGDLGGWVESEYNLSQEGECWIYDEGIAIGLGKIMMDAKVRDYGVVRGSATVKDHACIYDHAAVDGMTTISNRGIVNKYAHVHNLAKIEGLVTDQAYVISKAIIHEQAEVRDNTIVDGDVVVGEGVVVCGVTYLRGNAVLQSKDDYLTFKNNFSSGRYFTWTRSNDMWSVGCFYGTANELLAKAKHDGKRVYEGYKAYVELVEKLKKVVADDETN